MMLPARLLRFRIIITTKPHAYMRQFHPKPINPFGQLSFCLNFEQSINFTLLHFINGYRVNLIVGYNNCVVLSSHALFLGK